MARYIDADALIEALQADFDREGAKADDMAMRGLTDVSVKYSHGQFCFLNAIEQVKITPAADVVPKSEVANGIITDLQRMWRMSSLKDRIHGMDVYVISQRDYQTIIAEIRKKYTEEKKDENQN